MSLKTKRSLFSADVETWKVGYGDNKQCSGIQHTVMYILMCHDRKRPPDDSTDEGSFSRYSPITRGLQQFFYGEEKFGV